MQQSSIEQKAFMLSSHKIIEASVIAVLFFIGAIVTILAYLSFIGVITFVTPSSMMKVDLIILLALSLLLGRRIVSIFITHKKSMMASGLHMKMVLLFSAVSLVPAAFMAFFSLFFFHYGVQSWFSEQIKTAVVESNSIAQSYLEEHQNTIRADILAMANDLDRQYEVLLGNQNALKKMVDTQAFYRNLADAVIFSREGMTVLVYSGLDPLELSHITTYDIEAAQRGEIVVVHSLEDDHVQALVKLNNYADHYLLVGRGVDATVLARIEQTRAASQKYTSLEGQSSQIRVTLIAIYVALSGFLVLVSIWFALRIAKNFILPIENLVDASNRVRAGDLDVELDDKTGVMELDQLTQAYNRMTSQLSKQRNELVSANRQLDERRIFTETVLGGVSSGVLSVDNKGVIKLYNSSAETILNTKDQNLSGGSLKNIIPEAEDILKQVLAVDVQGDNSVQLEIPYIDPDGSKKDLLLRAVSEVLGEKNIGAIITFDDITNLKSAQRTAAWSDVARRIAHEIKNPLTPIQLSADRIRKKFSQYIPEEDREVFETCVETISCHVNDIGAMVTEFSSFARMPEPKVSKVDLGSLIRQCITLHGQIRSDVDIYLMGLLDEDRHMQVYIDEQLIRQAFVNVLQNALEAIPLPSKKRPKNKSSIWVWLVEKGDDICIVVRDNGEGFPEGQVLEKFLDPYVTHKENGTGLGLAIVKKIVNDHNGKVVLGELPWMKDMNGWNEIEKQAKKDQNVGAIVSMIFPVIHDKSSNKKDA